jgi:hypothetical protein
VTVLSCLPLPPLLSALCSLLWRDFSCAAVFVLWTNDVVADGASLYLLALLVVNKLLHGMKKKKPFL